MANNRWTPEQRLSVVDYYLKNSTSLKATAQRFNLHYITVFKWVKIFKEKGERGLISTHHSPWNRVKKEIENRVILLKEQQPDLTVRKAREMLKHIGINISLKGIWGIWKRAGLSGFRKDLLHDDFTKYIPWSSETERKYHIATILYNLGKIRDAAEVLNEMPSLPKNELLPKIPDRYLNLKRRVEKAYHLFGEVPIPQYIKNLRKLYKSAKAADLNYSALRVALAEVVALEWSTRIREQQLRIKEIEEIIKAHTSFKKRGSYLLFESKFTLLISKGILYSRLLKVKEARKIAQTCSMMLKRMKNPSPYLMLDLGALYNRIQEYKSAEYWFLKGIDGVDDKTRGIYMGSVSLIYLMRGNYKKALSILNDAKFYKWTRGATPYIYQSLANILNGNLSDALSSAITALKYSKAHQSTLIVWATMIIAGIYALLCEKRKSHSILRNLIPFLKRNELITQKKTVEYILHSNVKRLPNINIYPSLRLLHLLKNKNYFEALSYARKKGILMNFYQYLPFFPNIVLTLMEKGKNTKLPKPILRLPVFNKKNLVYRVDFLGKMRIEKDQRNLLIRLKPKDAAFLIYLCQRVMEPKKSLNLDEVYANFWSNSESASRNFSHLLVRIKKALKIPTHLLEMSRGSGTSVLINQGIYFTTDYQEFEQTLAQAKALQRAGEWSFARKEYLRAFKLFRGEPFKKNFDNWSVDMRFKILSQFETEAINFAKSCIEHGNKNDARKILQKVLKIIPDSEESQKLLETL